MSLGFFSLSPLPYFRCGLNSQLSSSYIIMITPPPLFYTPKVTYQHSKTILDHFPFSIDASDCLIYIYMIPSSSSTMIFSFHCNTGHLQPPSPPKRKNLNTKYKEKETATNNPKRKFIHVCIYIYIYIYIYLPGLSRLIRVAPSEDGDRAISA